MGLQVHEQEGGLPWSLSLPHGRALALVIGAAIACLLGFAANAWAATVTVTSASDSGAGSLRAAIAAADPGDTITFDGSLDGETIDLTTGAIPIDKSLTIEGPGASDLAVDAGHNSRIFVLSSGDLSISDLTLANAAGPEEGGAIYSESSGSLTVSDCTFTGNAAGGPGGSGEESNLGRGGAIFVSYASAGPTSVSGSIFADSRAGGPGGSGFQSGLGAGGAIWDGSDSLVVSNSTFTENSSGGDGGGEQAGNGAGGAIMKAGGLSLRVSDSEFSANTGGGNGGSGTRSGRGLGGAIYVSRADGGSPSLTVEDSSFTANTAGGNGGDGDASGSGEGGAIEHFSAGPLLVSGTTFEGNTAGGDGGAGGGVLFGPLGSGSGKGGAIGVAEFTASTSVSESLFEGNTAGGDGGDGFASGRGDGGAIADSATDQLRISGSTFRQNVAGGAKGSGNGSGRGAGGAVRAGGSGSLAVTASSFDFNAVSADAGGSGGAIAMFNRSLTVAGSTFAGNTVGEAGGGGSGGAIDVGAIPSLNASASIADSTFFGNDAGGGGASGWGGAISAESMSSLTLASVTIAGNSVGGPAGAGAGLNSGADTTPEGATVTAKATIISGNIGGGGASNCDVAVASSSYSLEGGPGQGSCGFDLPSADPELGPLANNGGPTKTQALPASSPAVDAVPAGNCPTSVDQRGEPRPDNGKAFCDVGAYELQDPPGAPSVTSAAAASFQAGRAGSFTVTSTGVPVPDLSLEGTLPDGVSFADNGDGTASLSGTPAPGAGGEYQLAIRASNGIAPGAEQSFTLSVQAPPSAVIATPVEAATYTQGEPVATGFSCAEGTGGPGVASCLDQDGRPFGAPLDTATIGPHTFTVTATSADELTGQASVAYTVVAAPADPSPPQVPGPPKLPPPLKGRALVSYNQEGGVGGPRPSLVVFKDRRARVTLGGCEAKLALRPPAWRRLRAVLRRAHLRALAGDYPAPVGSADLITHVIRSRTGTVRIALPQPERSEVARSLRPLLGALEGLASAGERRMPSSCAQRR
jgi:hypothetical protein